jgi:hypothetical protein
MSNPARRGQDDPAARALRDLERRAEQRPAEAAGLVRRRHDQQGEPPQALADERQRGAHGLAGVLGDPGTAGVGGREVADPRVAGRDVLVPVALAAQPPREVPEGLAHDLEHRGRVVRDGGSEDGGHEAEGATCAEPGSA